MSAKKTSIDSNIILSLYADNDKRKKLVHLLFSANNLIP